MTVNDKTITEAMDKIWPERVAAMREVMIQGLNNIQRLMDERTKHYDQKLEALDKSFQERFAQQDKATSVAFAAADKAVAAALGAAEKAVAKAEAASEKRFEGHNEFRGQLRDQAATFATRTEVSAGMRELDSKMMTSVTHIERRLEELSQQQIKNTGKFEGASLLWFGLLGIVTVAISLYALFRTVPRPPL